MNHDSLLSGSSLLLAGLLVACAGTAYGQREREIQPPSEPSQYGREFFVQLRSVFGRFRDADLDNAFERAQPIECSELVNERGEWRTVAFINEKRELGDWYRSNFEEVKSDLSVFIFKGLCRGERSPVQITTKFPVTESIDAYNQKRIGFEDIEVNVNAPVRASFDPRTSAYSFDLPYLFLVSQQDGENIYSLLPPRLQDRDRYATDVSNHWECKSVTAENVTYQFLICRTKTVSRGNGGRREGGFGGYGSSAYFILSDGREASSSVKLSFSDGDNTGKPIEDQSAVSQPPIVEPEWVKPDPDEKLLSLLRGEFRIRFDREGWRGRSGTAQALARGRLSTLADFFPEQGVDSCVWLPASAGSNGDPVGYAITVHDRDAQSSTSIIFEMRNAADAPLGTLHCFFPSSAGAAGLEYRRWTSIVGRYLSLEVR